jgi:hypothetical protein
MKIESTSQREELHEQRENQTKKESSQGYKTHQIFG